MDWIKYLVIIAVLYIGQSYYLMNDNAIESFLVEQSLLAMSDPPVACDNFSDDINVSINHKTLDGTWEVEGGKNEICGYMKQSHAALVITQANTNAHFENMTVESGFPWQSATARYDEVVSVSMQGLNEKLNSKTHEVVEIKKGLTGLKIITISSTGGM